MDKGSTSGVTSSINSRTCFPAVAYFVMSGGMTVAWGQSFNALNMGIADFTPWIRAM